MKKRASRNGEKFFGKIKTEHAIIEGLYDLLNALAAKKEIQSIIPGRIMRRGASLPKPAIHLTIRTGTGWKAVGKSKGSVQDLFIVTGVPDEVEKIIRELE